MMKTMQGRFLALAPMPLLLPFLVLAMMPMAVWAEPPSTAYVGTLDAQSVTLAWGSRDEIGRSAQPDSPVTIRIAGRTIQSMAGWERIDGLSPDRDYEYVLSSEGGEFARGTIRTWPLEADSLVFFVIGDWGNGSRDQTRVARAMTAERTRLESQGKHVRFVLSTGDNLYGLWDWFNTGADDDDWDDKFFQPYRDILRAIPFYAVLGNHDGNESDPREDLDQYLDNFFFPGGRPARWYQFRFADLAEFFALDSTRNTVSGKPSPAFLPDGEQSLWLRDSLERPGAPPWRIAYMHHPMFTAGPEHEPSAGDLRHWLDLFSEQGVQAVFSGHEHNFQFSERGRRTQGVQFVVSGAGGQLRGQDVRQEMRANAIAAWAPQRHFTVVEVTRGEMVIKPVSYEAMSVLNPEGGAVRLPLRVPRVSN